MKPLSNNLFNGVFYSICYYYYHNYLFGLPEKFGSYTRLLKQNILK